MKNSLVIIFLLFINFYSLGQKNQVKQSNSPLKKDSLENKDTLKTTPTDTLFYNGDHIEYDSNDSTIFIYNNGELLNKDIKLTADTITYNVSTGILNAWGTPILKDNNDIICGEKMLYNLKTKRGKIEYGSAVASDDKYNGQIIARTQENNFLIRNFDYCSCAKDTTHYFFYSKDVKIIQNEKIIAKPVVLNIGEVPLGVLPFFVFPIKKGRRSGLLTPKWGEFSDGGNRASYLKNIGYYFAINDYTDLETKLDFTNGDGFFFQNVYLNADFKYKKRYILDGYIDGRYEISRTEKSLSKNYGISYSHNHNIYPDNSFYIRGSGDIVGNSNYYKESTLDREDYLKRRLYSNMAIVKNWKKAGIGTNIDFKYNQDLDTKENTLEFPSFSFTANQRPLYKRKNTDKSDTLLPWYERISYSYGLKGVNISKNELVKKYDIMDTLYDTSSVMRKYSANDMAHSLSFSFSPSPKLGYINLSPHLSIRGSMFFKKQKKIGIKRIDTTQYYNSDPSYDTVYNYDTTSTFEHREEYNMGVSLNTRLYGISTFDVGILKGFRHILAPNLTYNFSPALKNGEQFIRAKYANNANKDEQQRISFSASNVFQVKLEDQKGNDKTITLANLSIGTGYNFAAKELENNWSDLNINASSNLYMLNLSYSSSYSFYDENNVLIFKKQDIPLIDRLKPRLNNTRIGISTGTNISGKISNGKLSAKIDQNPIQTNMNPWNLGIHFNYSRRKNYNQQYNIYENTSSFSLRDNLKIDFSDKWHLTYSSIYDFENNELVDQTITLVRELNCWEAIFNWVISGYRAGYYLKINIINIPDIKFEKSGGAMSGFSGSGFSIPNYN